MSPSLHKNMQGQQNLKIIYISVSVDNIHTSIHVYK